MTQWGDISAAEYAEIEQRFIATMAKQRQRWRRQQLDAIDTELARRSVQKALCDGLSGHVKPEATVQSPASAAMESAMMKDFDHVADAGKVALCGMTDGVKLPTWHTSDTEKLANIAMERGIEIAHLQSDKALAEAEITRLHSIIGHMASQISALLTPVVSAVKASECGALLTPAAPPDAPGASEPDAATGAIPAPAAAQGGPVTANPAPMPFNALRWTR